MQIDMVTKKRGKEDLDTKTQKVRSSYLPHAMIEPFYRYKLTNNSWQERMSDDRTFEGITLSEANIHRVRQVLDEEGDADVA